MDGSDYLAHLRRDGDDLLAAARRDPSAPVPGCPQWDVTALVEHTATIHHWVVTLIKARATARMPKGGPPTAGWDALAGWYEEGLDAVIDALAGLRPGDQVWNWTAGVAPAEFWVRRMAQETVVHRWDAQSAHGDATPIDAALAADGIDEFLGFAHKLLGRRPVAGLHGVLALMPTDVAGPTVVTLASDGIGVARAGEQHADATVTGPASDVYLWLVGRRGVGVLAAGDEGVLDGWAAVTFD